MLIIAKIFLTAMVSFSGAAEPPEQNSFFLKFQQNDYKLNAERAEVVSYNREYLQDLAVKTFKYNRTCTAFNGSVTVKVDMGNEIEVIVQAYKFASNEYRHFPMRFQLNACQGLSANIFGSADVHKCGNFIGCPIRKGNKIDICNFTPDPSKFPPLIPSGKYMAEVQVLYRSAEIAVGRAYGEIYRPFAGK